MSRQTVPVYEHLGSTLCHSVLSDCIKGAKSKSEVRLKVSEGMESHSASVIPFNGSEIGSW